MSRDYFTCFSLLVLMLIIIGLHHIQAKQVILYESKIKTDSNNNIIKSEYENLHGKWNMYYDKPSLSFYSCPTLDPTHKKKESFLELGFFYKNYTDQLNVNLKYYILDCIECVDHFSFGKYDTDNINSNPKLKLTKNGEDNSYKLIKQIKAKQLTENIDNFKINSINFSFQVNKLATKLVFMEYRSCITLSEITIYYNICDSYRVDKMILPINGISKGVNQAKAKCIENAESMNDEDPIFLCSSGNWSHITGACICSPGYTNINDQCSECPIDTYKTKKGDFACHTCPERSSTMFKKGNTKCDCDSGFRRLSNEQASTDCSAPPSAVESIRVSHTSNHAVNISWSIPSSLGFRLSNEIEYEIQCISGCHLGDLMYRPSQTKINTPSVFINGLSVSVEYKFIIKAINKMGSIDNHTSVVIEKYEKPNTPIQDDLQVTNIEILDRSDNLIHLKWDGPLNDTNFKRYDVWYYENIDSIIKTTSKINMLKISGLNSNSGYHIKIRSVYFLSSESEILGLFTESKIIRTKKLVIPEPKSPENEVTSKINDNNPDQSTNMAIIAGAICAIIFCIIIVIIMAVLLIKKKKVPTATLR